MIVELILLLVGFLLIAGTFLYVASEFSFVTVDRATVNREAANGDGRAKSVLTALRSLSTQLSGAQVGITVTTLALGFVMEPSLASLLNRLLGLIGIPEGVGYSVTVPLALIIATALSMVFGELVPKNIALAEPLNTAKGVVRPMLLSTMLFRPLIWALNGTANGVLRLFGVEPQEELRSARSSTELGSLVRRSAQQGTLEEPTAGLLARSISFSDKTADDVLTPRTKVRFVKATDPATAIIDAAVQTGHARFPVTGADSDDVVGLVHLKRAVAIPPDERARVTAGQLMVDVPVIPETLPLDELLDQLRERGLQMAVVVDEYGGTAGILTLEDVVEELVGEITDEHDPVSGRMELLADGTWVLDGTLRPDEIEEFSGIALPEAGTYETVAGLLISELGRLAAKGDHVDCEAIAAADAALGALPGGHRLEPEAASDLPRRVQVRLDAAEMDGHRIEAVRMSSVGVHDNGEVADR